MNLFAGQNDTKDTVLLIDNEHGGMVSADSMYCYAIGA